jgi:nicotinate phosphoribosyltransferase
MNYLTENLSMLCDFYELTMANGYLGCGMGDKIVYFDAFYRSNPDGGGYAIAAGLEQIVDYINNLKFSDEDIGYLRSKKCFSEEFLLYLKNFRFTGDVWAVPEGTVVFPGDPLLIVRAPVMQAQFIETYILMALNHQSLIATKASRMVRAAAGRPISEFGARRAHGSAAAMLGARAAYIGGCAATSCTIADLRYGVPATGTMAHSWVQMFDDEYTAFKTYCEIYPQDAVLLIDTYNVLESGLPNAIRAFREVLLPRGITKCGVRLDSGDIAYLSRRVRERLDEAGFPQCRIIASNSLDEYIISDLLRQGAKVDAFGIGERLITSKSDPVFGAVYKLAAVEDEAGRIIPKIKISENVGKITTPHFKKVYRLRDRESGKAEADLICIWDERIDDTRPLEIFDPEYTWKRKTLTDFTAHELLVPVFRGGKQIYKLPALDEIRAHCTAELDGVWDEVRRFTNPHNYYVDLSERLWHCRHDMIKAARAKKSK